MAILPNTAVNLHRSGIVFFKKKGQTKLTFAENRVFHPARHSIALAMQLPRCASLYYELSDIPKRFKMARYIAFVTFALVFLLPLADSRGEVVYIGISTPGLYELPTEIAQRKGFYKNEGLEVRKVVVR